MMKAVSVTEGSSSSSRMWPFLYTRYRCGFIMLSFQPRTYALHDSILGEQKESIVVFYSDKLTIGSTARLSGRTTPHAIVKNNISRTSVCFDEIFHQLDRFLGWVDTPFL
jgi:hypothetical protein